MAILVQDTFDDVALDVDISTRVPPISDSGSAWVREVNTTARGDGGGSIKFSGAGAAIKTRSLAESVVAVRTQWTTGGAANSFFIFLGENAPTTIYPRYAYATQFNPSAATVKFYRIDNFSSVQMGSTVSSVAYASPAECVMTRNANDFAAFVDGVSVGGFTDATYAPNGARTRLGMCPNPYTNDSGRLLTFEVLDTYSPAAGVTARTIVEELW